MNRQLANSPSTILVTGATGQIGSLVARALLDRGIRVRALVRDVGRTTDLAEASAELVAGDLARRDTLAPALKGVDRGFLLSPSSADQVELQSTFVRAAVQAGLRHVVKLSGPHADPHAPTRFARWRGEVERAIQEGGLPFTSVQPVYFMQNAPTQIRSAGGHFFTPVAPDLPVSIVDARDVAAVAVAALTDDRDIGQTYVVTGPALVSQAHIAAVDSQVTGAQVDSEQVNVERFVQALLYAGQPDWLARGIAEQFLHMDSDVADSGETTVGRLPIAFRQFAWEHVEDFGVAQRVVGP